MKQPYANPEVSKESEGKHEEKVEGREGAQKNEEANEETEVVKAVKEELSVEAIMKDVAINNNHINDKLEKAVNKYIQIYAPNHIDSILQTKQ